MGCKAGHCLQSIVRLLLWVSLLFSAVAAIAADGTIEAQFFPDAVVADGVSRLAVTVTIRDRNGNLVPDGTQVLFEATLGGLTQSQVGTVQGIARTNLVAGTLPGTSIVTVSVLQFRATGRYPVRFLRSRAELREANQTLDVVGPKRLTFSPNSALIRVDGPGRKAVVRYGDLTVSADDLQINTSTLEVRAREATLIGLGEELDFRSLQFNLKQRTGLGVLRVMEWRTVIEPTPPVPKVSRSLEQRLRFVQIAPGEPMKPIAGPFNNPAFELQDIYADTTLVYARRATVVLGRETLLQDAVVDVNGTRVLSVPKFRVGQQLQSEVITDEFVQVSNNQLALNFPYYLQLGAGDDAALRFRYGNRFSRGVGGGGGIFLDFEKNWNGTEESRGGLALRGVGRDDWVLNARQIQRISPTMRASFQVDLNRLDSLFGNMFVEQSLNRWLLTYSGSTNRTLRKGSFDSSEQNINLTQRAQRLGSLPLSVTTGVSYNSRTSKSQGVRRRTEYAAADLFFTFDSVRLSQSVLSTSGRVSRIDGHNVRNGWTSSLSSSLSGTLGTGVFASLNYDFSDDAFSASLLGRHRLSSNLTYDVGNAYLSVFASRSLDQSRYSIQSDASYRLGQLWRLGGVYTVEGFAGSSFSDSSAVVAYRIGFREIGLSYSLRTRRLGFELLGTPIR